MPPPAHAEQPAPPWHVLSAGDVLERLDADADGLAGSEAARRLRAGGPNELMRARPTPAWRILWDQLRSLVVGLLAAVAVVAWLLGDPLEAGAIAAVLLINVVIGFVTEWRARRAMEALGRLQVLEAVALRDGAEREVDARELVPGDVIVLEPGAAVPADARLLEATELRVAEAALTGESAPVEKHIKPVEGENPGSIPVADRRSMVYKGTVVADGTARAVVTGTGLDTEIGQVTELVQTLEQQETPIEGRLRILGHRLIWLTLGIVVVVSGLGIVRGRDPLLMIETGIALGIAAVPEGLPVVATVTLAVGMWRMARRNALIRRLPAVEALGSATVICADKTGTLTTGQMTLTRIEPPGRSLRVSGVGLDLAGEFLEDDRPVEPGGDDQLRELLRTAVLANRAGLRRDEDGTWTGVGDPTEVALLVAGHKAGMGRDALLERHPREGEIPFSNERRLMATFHRTPSGEVEARVKGAPDRILELSDRALEPEGATPLDDQGREEILALNDELAGEGLRVLALARRTLTEGKAADESSLEGLEFLGLVGLYDPPAPGVKETVAAFRSAGVRPIMITGDQAPTARAVAAELGLLDGDRDVIDGAELSRLDGDALSRRLARTGAFARVSPRQKVDIVEALQRQGEVVGMLGDGVNDAPALKRANIGVAMGGRGTDVARETADLVLQDDRFGTVGVAVEEGRVIFDNIRKFIFYLFSCNLSEVGTLFVAAVAGLPMPLLPLQLLWLNMITDVFPALALAMEPGEPDVMDRPPRDQDAAILSRDFSAVVGIYGLVLTMATLAAFGWGLASGTDARAGTLAFMTLALGQLFHVFNARSVGPIRLNRAFLENPWIWGAVALTVGLQLAAVYAPGLRAVLRTVPLEPRAWGVVVVASSAPLVAGQIWKRILERRRAGERAGA